VPAPGVVLNDAMDDSRVRATAAEAFKLVGAEANSVDPGQGVP